MALYDMRIEYRGWESEAPADWYGPYELTDDDIDKLHVGTGYNVRNMELRPHNCDDPTEDGRCGHMREGMPAPY